MYEMEEVEEEKGRQFAKDIGAIFKYTSSKNNTGIEEMFRAIGNRYIDPSFEDAGAKNSLDAQDRQTIKLSRESANADKPASGGCCKK